MHKGGSLSLNSDNETTNLIRPEGMTIEERFSLPVEYGNFKRVQLQEHSFGAFLRQFPLLEHGSDVFYFDGRKKKKDVHEAVFDIDVGTKDLQQCADAVVRLYAEYLFSEKRFEEIGFHFTNGFFCDYLNWRNGKRIQVSGNNVRWIQSAAYDDSYENFRKYLETVFMYAGTISLSKELNNVIYDEIMPGDVLIQGGSPGHAVLVVDCAVDENGQKLVMFAQSYMPAQSIHILKNQGDPEISPWYRVDSGIDQIVTPEWTFKTTDLKGFPVIR